MRRSKLATEARRESLLAGRDRSAEECTEEALALFEMAVEALRRNEGLSRSAAVRRLLASRSAGRRPSRVSAP